jgi:hypothetical protein
MALDVGIQALPQSEKWLSEFGQDMINLGEEFIGSEEGPPSGKDGMSHLQHTSIDDRVVRFQPGNEIINQSVPALPEVTVCYYTDCFTELSLDAPRHRYHQPNNLALDRSHILLWKFVVAFHIGPVATDEVLEEEGAGESGVVFEAAGGRDLE